MTHRVIIRAHTARRDIAPAVLVERMLQRLGCQTFIASVRNFEWVMRKWQPQGVVLLAPGVARRARELRPDSQIIFLDGEGFQSEDISTVTLWRDEPEQYTSLDLCLLWGPIIREHMTNLTPQFDQSITRVIGNPKFDLIRYMPDSVKPDGEPKKVGILGRFPTINHHEGIPTIRGLWSKVNLDFVVNCCYAFHAIHNVVQRILDETDYIISIRPHPMEQVEAYRDWVIPSFGAKHRDRFEIDESLVITDWIAQQRAVIAPTSTAFLEAYLLKVPVINIDRLAGTAEYNAGYAQVCAEWQAAAYQPNSVEEAVDLIRKGRELEVHDAAIEKQISEYCAWEEGGSASWNAARMIVDHLDSTNPPDNKHWPRSLVNLRDEISFRRAMRRNPLHHNFSYREGFHKLPDYYDSMIDTMMKSA